MSAECHTCGRDLSYGPGMVGVCDFCELRAENERLRMALQRILDHGQTHEEPCWALHNGDCADTMQEIARATLASLGASPSTSSVSSEDTGGAER